MRIGYDGFSAPLSVDVLVPPPSSVRYAPTSQPRRELTTSQLVELRGYASQANHTIELAWQDIPERDLSLLAFIKPNEVVTLIGEDGRARKVVFSEPVRAMQSGVTAFDGTPLYTASLRAHQVAPSAFQAAQKLSLPASMRSLGTSRAPAFLNRDAPTPTQPNPANYSPVLSRAASNLPPTVSPGEGVRFTFDTYADDTERGRYYSTDTDAYLELQYATSQDFRGWYSHVREGGTRNETAVLERWPFELDSQWALGILMWAAPNLSSGSVLNCYGPKSVLGLDYRVGSLHLTLNTNGNTRRAQYAMPTSQFHYLGLRYSNGTLYSSWNGAAELALGEELYTTPNSAKAGFYLGGGSVYVDDLFLSSGDDVDLVAIYEWLFGNGPV